MQFEFNEQQRMIRDMARDFADREIVPIAAEIDEAEAMGTFRTGRRIVVSILAVTILLALLLTAFALWSGARANRVLREARDNWERVAAARTADLADSEERSRLLLESTRDGIFGVDLDGIVTFCNNSAARILGYTREAIHGQAVHALIHHSHADGSPYPVDECPMHKAYAEGASSDVDNEVLWCRDGSAFEVEYSSVPVRKADTIIGAVVVFRDISARKRADRELRKLSMATEASPVTVVVTDTEGVIEYVNPKFTEVTGYTAEEAVGQNPRVLSSGDQPKAFYADLWDTIADGKVWTGDFSNRRKSGAAYWEHASISPIQGDDGVITHYVAVKEDITDRKRMEAALLEAKTAAEAATRAKSDFLANMSHEIRTPMNAVLGMLHLALRTDLTPKQSDYLRKAHAAAAALLGIINDILDFSKIEAGKLELETIDFALDDVLDSVAGVTAIKARDKGIELLFKRSAEVSAQLRGDPLRLGQILTNLASNAVKFTSEGEIVIAVALESEDKGIVTLRFSVRDTGLGMTQEQAAKLFQPFSQADASTTREHGGTGLGLSICKRLTDMMGGEISVTSEPGKGSRFWFEIEMLVVGESPQGLKGEKPVIVGFEGVQKKILVVDDIASNRDVLVEMLSPLGFELDQASSGEEGLVVAGNFQPDLILTDLVMPGMDGMEMMGRIRQLPGFLR